MSMQRSAYVPTLSDIAAINNMPMIYARMFRYLFEKYRTAESSRASPVQKRLASRDTVTIPS